MIFDSRSTTSIQPVSSDPDRILYQGSGNQGRYLAAAGTLMNIAAFNLHAGMHVDALKRGCLFFPRMKRAICP
jgi:hypothetical protein